MRWPPKAPVVALVLVGILATAAFAAFGLRALTRWLLQADELDGRGGSGVRSLLLAPLGRGPLQRLADGQRAIVHYRSQGCFHSIDAVLTFVKDPGGRMSVGIVDGRPERSEAPYRRLLTEAEVRSIDRQLVYSQYARGDGCTTREEFEVVIRGALGEVSRSHFVDESCDGLALGPGGVSLWALWQERAADLKR